MTVTLIGPTWVFQPDPNGTHPIPGGMTAKPDLDIYSIELTFHQGSRTVDYVIDDFGPFNPNLPARQTGSIATNNVAPSIEVLFNDPGDIDPNTGLTLSSEAGFNSLTCSDVSNDQGTMLYTPGNPATLGQSATFGLSNFIFPGGGFGGGSNIEGPYIEYDLNAHTTPPGVQPPRSSFIGVLWDSIDTSAFPPTLMNPVGLVGSNSTGIPQPLIITNDSPPIYDALGNVLRPGGGDRIAVTGTDPLIDTTLENAARNVLQYPGNFRPTVAPDYTGDEFDVSSDSDFGYPFVNGRPSYQGDLNSILGPLTIAPVAGHNTVIISDKGNTTLTAPVNVTLSSTAIDQMPGTQTVGTIDGLAPATITYENSDPGDPFNPNLPLGTMDVTLIATD
ncbi:MAG TPA: hypothetical protein VGH32_04930, partial [Pirellulales bacterium]